MKRRTLFKAMAGALVAPRVSVASTEQPQRIIFVYNQGGWDVSMLFDPKFSNPQVDTASDGEIDTVGGLQYVASNRRPNVSSFMSQFAGQSTIINGIGVGSISHKKCERLLFTGSRLSDSPDVGSIIAQRFTSLPLPYAILSGPRMTGGLGYNVSRVDQTFVSILRQETVIQYDQVQQFIQASNDTDSDRRTQEYFQTLARREQLRSQVDLFPMTIDNNPENQIELSVQLLANNVSAVTMVQINPPPFHQWDTHSSNDDLQSGCMDYLFQHLNRLGTLLQTTPDGSGNPLIDSTTVVVLSEMGRTPVYNSNLGKDHWPYTSMLMFGHGVAGGRVVGATDAKLTSAPINLETGEQRQQGTLLQSGHVLAGLLHRFDIDPSEYYSERPFLAPFQ